MIKFGVSVHQYQPDLNYDLLKRLALECEKLGFDSLWLNDHLMPCYLALPPIKPWFECWTTLSALSSETKKLRLGTLVLCNSYRYPSVLAKMASTLDVISNGRLDFGIGAGWFEQEYIAYGIPFPKTAIRIGQLREAVKIIKKTWTEEKASFKGKYYSIEEAVCIPKPVQKPHPPIWIGGTGEKLLMKVVAELADGWNLPFVATPEEFMRKVCVLEKHCLSFGRDLGDIQKSLTQFILICEDQQELKEKIKRYKATYPREAIREMSVEELVRNFPTGTPQECLEKIYRYVDAGVTYFILDFPDALQLKPLRLFAEHIIRAIRK